MQQFIEKETTPKPRTILQQTFAAVTEQDRNHQFQTDCARTLLYGVRADDESSDELEESDNGTNQDDDQNQDGSRDLIDSEAYEINNDFDNYSDIENYFSRCFDINVSGQGGGSPSDFKLFSHEEQQQVLGTSGQDEYLANISNGNDQVEPELFDARLVTHTDSIHKNGEEDELVGTWPGEEEGVEEGLGEVGGDEGVGGMGGKRVREDGGGEEVEGEQPRQRRKQGGDKGEEDQY
jgi:hypothetical protein